MDNDDIIEKINAKNMKAIAETDIVDAITASNMNAMSGTSALFFAQMLQSMAGLINSNQLSLETKPKVIENDKESEAKVIKDKLTCSKRKIQLDNE